MIARFLLALALLVPAAPPPASGADPHRISIRVHDYAGLDEDDLSAAQAEVSAIFATAGVHFDWRVAVRPDEVRRGIAKWPSDAASRLQVLIVNSDRARGVGMREDVAGYAAVTSKAGGHLAFVVADRTKMIAEGGKVPHSRVLALVMAHELAHLFMPSRPHAVAGIMRARWKPAEFRFLERPFSRAEAGEIRQAVSVLTGAANTIAD
jgi:hypothetical protein